MPLVAEAFLEAGLFFAWLMDSGTIFNANLLVWPPYITAYLALVWV